MPPYRLLVDLGDQGPVQSLSINLASREEALIVAQRYDRPSELWDQNGKLCRISRGAGGMWVITSSGDPPQRRAARKTAAPPRRVGTANMSKTPPG